MIDKIKATVDIVELVSQDESALRAVGREWRSGHYAKHPSASGKMSGTSLRVTPETQTWYCYECSKGGSVIDWVMDRDECDVSQAIKWLADKYRIVADGNFDPKAYQQRQSVRVIMRDAFEWYHAQLPDSMRGYLLDRGLENETVDTLKIGYAPSGGDALRDYLKGKGYTPKDMLATGLFHQGKTRAYDHYQDRIVFPYWLRDEPVYSIGRLPQSTPETIAARHEADRGKYKKHKLHEKAEYVSPTAVQHVIYGQNSLHGQSDVILTEGIIDAVLAHQHGYAALSPVTVRFQKSDTDELIRLCSKMDTVFIVNDNEKNEQGKHGAMDTAESLFGAGLDVRVVELPRPEGIDKIDLADFLADAKTFGHDLQSVLDTAPTYLEIQVQSIAKMNGRKRTVAATLLLQRLKGLEPLECEAGLVLMSEAKIGRIGTLRQQMKRAAIPAEIEIDPDIRSHRKITEQPTHYTAYNPETQGVDTISNFIIVPTLRVFVDELESIVCDFVSEHRTVEGIVIDRTAWNDKQKFMNTIPSVDFWFDGTLSHIQSILAIVAGYDVPTKRGTDKVGLDRSGVWVLPSGGFTKDGFQAETDLAYTPQGGVSEWGSILDYRHDGFKEIQADLSELLPQLNAPEIIWGAIGWFAATPFKPNLTAKHGGFPFLNVTGTRSSGKSSMLRIFARLFGYAENSVLFSCDQTPFVLLRLLSSTSTIPVILDEYKYDMDVKKRETLIRYIRRTYNGEAELRGNADKSLTRYTLTAPVVLAGEIDITESAMLERMIHLPVEPKGLDDMAKKAHQRLRDLPLNAFALPYACFTLQGDFESRYGRLMPLFADILPDCPDRISDNLKALVFGICQFCDFIGMACQEEYLVPTVNAAFRALTETGDRVKVGFDKFIEHLATLAEVGRLVEGVHFGRNGNQLGLRFNSCFAEFRKFARETNLDDEVLTANAYRRQARENQLGYVGNASHPVRFGDGEAKRCMVLNLDDANDAGLDVAGFITPMSDVTV